VNGPSKVNGPTKVQSVDRALSLLDRVAGAAPEGETAARLAQQCDINRATAWRLLGALEDHGLVEREPGSNRYKLGFALLRMAAAAGYDGLVRKTRPILDRVCAQTGETADLAVAGLHGVTYVSEAQPPSVLQISWLRREVPLHATSTGKAFLAWLPADEARSLLDDPLPAYTDTTVTDHEKLMDELALTRERGYAECSGELEGRLYGVSAPILSRADGRPLAVFGIWGFLDRVPASRFPELGKIAIAAATEITAVMNT
jgi:DNA-binding IclR family transcriptional regulator